MTLMFDEFEIQNIILATITKIIYNFFFIFWYNFCLCLMRLYLIFLVFKLLCLVLFIRSKILLVVLIIIVILKHVFIYMIWICSHSIRCDMLFSGNVSIDYFVWEPTYSILIEKSFWTFVFICSIYFGLNRRYVCYTTIFFFLIILLLFITFVESFDSKCIKNV